MVCRKAAKRLARRGARNAEQKEELSAFRDECADIDEEITDNLAFWVSAAHSEMLRWKHAIIFSRASLTRDKVFAQNLIVTMHNLFLVLFSKIMLIVTMHSLFLVLFSKIMLIVTMHSLFSVLSRKITWNKLLKAIVTLMLFIAVVNLIFVISKMYSCQQIH